MERQPPPSENTVTLDAWQVEILRQRALLGPEAADSGRGRVLRVKLGYNPNSSSIGSVVSILMWSAAFGAVVMNVFAALIRREAGAARVLPDGEEDAEARGPSR